MESPENGDISPLGQVRRGVCFVIAAPSGTGKSTLARLLLEREPNASLSISVTTRAPRPGEVDGVHYLFRDQAAFDTMVDHGDLLEWARIFDHSYGSPRAPVEAALRQGRDVVFDIDWQGYRQVRAKLPNDVVGVFVMPPSLRILTERLRRRGDPEAQIANRMRAVQDDLSHVHEFDYVVVNDQLSKTIDDIVAILNVARMSTRRLAPPVNDRR